MDDQNPIETLIRYTEATNICDELEPSKLTQIGRDVVKWTKLDDASRADWKKRSKEAMDMALQVVQEKTFPWAGAANVKYPLITVAALQFNARAYPAIVNGNKIVKGLVNGADPDGSKMAAASRVSSFMNYQLLEEMPEWEEQTDKLLLALPVEGCQFKKTFFDPGQGRNVSEWIRPDDFIVDYKTKNLATCPRMTHRLWFYPQEIKERQLVGLWADVDLNISKDDIDDEKLQEFYEQHTLLDLDGDGYKEPYCVTVHCDSERVVRIKANYSQETVMVSGDASNARVGKIARIDYFTKFTFIPAPDGGFYDVGFGQMIGPLSASVDTTINQLLDAGTLSNNSSGFKRKGTKIGQKSGGSVQFSMGEFKDIDIPAGVSIDQSIYQMQFPGPSPVLFNLLGMLIQAAKDITGVQDVMTGGQQQNETATTTMARIEQGLKVFSAIYKRVYRGFNEEFQKLYKLNAQYLNPEVYFRVLDDNSQGVVTLQDFNVKEANIRPVSDPSLGTTMQKMAKADLLMKVMADPRLNGVEIYKRFFDAAEIEGFEQLMLPPEKWPQPPPDTSELEMELKSLQLRDQSMKLYADTVATYAKALESMASAESKEVGPQYGLYRAQLSELTRMIGEANANQGRRVGVEAGPSNGGGAEVPEGLGAGGNVGPDRGVELPKPQLAGDSMPVGGMQG